MKKKTVITVLSAVTAVIVISAVFAFCKVFPKAPTVELPSDIVGVYVDGEKTSEKEETNFLNMLNEAKPTRRQSVNDRPTVQPYITFEIRGKAKTLYCYMYADNYGAYFEIPYVGIYKIQD